MTNQTYEIEIFKAGEHTASNGATLDFPRHKLREAVTTYNPQIFRAPAIISHDTGGISDNSIADKELCYGVPHKLRLDGDSLRAIFTKLSPKLVQWLRDGALHSLSPSFYLPNSPNNPYPGKLSLRHIAFLGKTPPAVKGLAPIPQPPVDWSEAEFEEFGYCEFNVFAPEEGVVDFSIGITNMQVNPHMIAADLFQRYRENLIATEDLETAESVLPGETIAALREQAVQEQQKDRQILDLQMEVQELRNKCSEFESQLENYSNWDEDEDEMDYGQMKLEYGQMKLEYGQMKSRIAELEEMMDEESEYGEGYYKRKCGDKDKQIAELTEQLKLKKPAETTMSPMSYSEMTDYKGLMKTLKMTASAVAEATGIDIDELTDYVNGDGELTKKEIEKLNSILNTEMSDKQEEIEYAESQLAAKIAELAEREDALAQREAELADKEQKAEFSEVSKKVDELINAGKVNAQRRDRTIKLLLNASNDSLIEFSEDEMLTPRQELIAQLESVKPWNFGETIVKGDEIPATDNSIAVTPGATQESVQGLAAVNAWCIANKKDFNSDADFNEALKALNIEF
ncbi:prohead scaffold and peptidase [Nodularia phage vB_NpeS-2AV2]|uniref:Prohead scaffold and peptidase n=3 Tax=Ravarandavirus TaxID=2843444 RepID=A0A482MKR3_9CAUD|nr:head maturation protease [Nodularia phage vB_NpeS-2AV2]YP_009844843.1 head maturation protease [Nodularia phage vB_NspS-kac68v161]ALY07480.1 prohead scaffold and peptidase [Nodularia phage vB_NpeS-2AV2]QBQ73684.1 prohead scaffold and peptidase [Nodularia phage vB_NspS-kac68v161]QBQ73882.1 prohead scaffold and peptidase [Nodularia phage vB_NspS-kac68v162]